MIDSSLTLVDILRERANVQHHEIAYTFLEDGESQEINLTYGELDLRVRAIAVRLRELGAEGERVLLLFPSSLEFITAFYGCLYAGATAVPTYPPDPLRLQRTLPRFLSIVSNARPIVALTTTQIVDMVRGLTARYPILQTIHWIATDTLLPQLASSWYDPGVKPETLAFLQYTSGSTANPKGVMLTHGNIIANEHMIKTAFEHTKRSIMVCWLPLYHDMGLIGNVIQTMYFGGKCILMSPLHFLQRPFRWLKAISHYKAQTSGAPNFAYDLCVRKIKLEQRAMLDLSSWDSAYNGAEPVRLRTLEDFIEIFAPCGFRREAFNPCYGLAEASVFVSGGIKNDPPVIYTPQHEATDPEKASVPVGSTQETLSIVGCGRTWLEQQVIIVDPRSAIRCSSGREGEIWVAGPNVAQGYWNNPDETEKVFKAYLADTGEGPFLRTGDLGFFVDGELFITGRIKDLIIIDGLNHYPQDIEFTVENCHPALRKGCSAAFALLEADKEKLAVAVEITRSNPSSFKGIDPDEIRATIKRAVSKAHDVRVHEIALLKAGTIPKTSSGKIQRNTCREGLLQGTLEFWEPSATNS